MARRRRQNELAQRASAEFGVIAGRIASFEASVSGAALMAEATRRRLRRKLTPLIADLERHVASAESASGLLAEIEVELGRSHEISTARRLHRSAARQASELCRVLDDADGFDLGEITKLGRRLSAALRRHQELEAELILMAFDQDIGGGD